MTATEVSELVGLSPSACSWHLRALAKAGLAERTTATDGRETRWQALARGLSFGPAHSQDPAYLSAARVLAEQYAEYTTQVQRAWADRADGEDARWQRAAVHTEAVVWLTPEELDALHARWQAYLQTYRRPSDGERPQGSRQVLVTLLGVPFELEWLAEQMRPQR